MKKAVEDENKLAVEGFEGVRGELIVGVKDPDVVPESVPEFGGVGVCVGVPPPKDCEGKIEGLGVPVEPEDREDRGLTVENRTWDDVGVGVPSTREVNEGEVEVEGENEAREEREGLTEGLFDRSREADEKGEEERVEDTVAEMDPGKSVAEKIMEGETKGDGV